MAKFKEPIMEFTAASSPSTKGPPQPLSGHTLTLVGASRTLFTVMVKGLVTLSPNKFVEVTLKVNVWIPLSAFKTGYVLIARVTQNKNKTSNI